MPPVVYESDWWSISLPEGWQGRSDQDCATFTADPEVGVLQISAARKESSPVTDEDLKDFAGVRTTSQVRLDPATAGAFSGFTARGYESRRCFREWWLRSGHLMIYATYNVDIEHESDERGVVAEVISTLRAS